MNEQDCALCLRSFKFHKTKPSENEVIDRLKAVCGTYIKSDVSRMNNSFSFTWDNYDSLWMRDNPFCPTCNDSAKHLMSLDDRLQQIQKDLTDFVKLFHNEIFKYREEKIVAKDSNSAPAINPEIKEEIYYHSDDSNFYGNGWDGDTGTDNDIHSAPTINPEIKEENHLHSDDSTSYDIAVMCHLEDISRREGRPKRKAALKNKRSRYEISSSDENVCSEDDFVPITQHNKRGRKRKPKNDAKSIIKKLKNTQTAQTGLKWKCKICNETYFCIIITERRHMRVFHPEEEKIEGSISCEICQETFEGPVLSYEIHCLEHKGELAFECQLCHRKFPSIQNYTDHYRFTVCGKRVMMENSEGVEKTFNCNTCNKDFNANYLLLLHRLSHINFAKSPITCELCGKPFPVDYRGGIQMEKHFLSHTKELPYPCDICGRQYGYIYSLEQHRLTHKGKTCKCGVCGSTFANPNGLYRHKYYLQCPTKRKNLKKEQDVEIAVKVTCDICGNTYKTRQGLEKHKRVAHCKETSDKSEMDTNSNSGKLQCDICGLDFIRKTNYTKHLKSHLEENPFQCANPDCQQKFRVFYDLKEHYNDNPNCKSVKDAKHEKYKHKCEICGRRTKTEAALRVHQMTHTGEKPHLCDICGMSFNRKDRLKQHTQKHDQSYVENPLSCRSCPFKCKMRKDLRTHYKKSPTCHSKLLETMKHKCDICGKKFYTKLKLMAHSAEQHQGEGVEVKITKSLQCKICQKAFYFQQQLSRHQKSHEKS